MYAHFAQTRRRNFILLFCLLFNIFLFFTGFGQAENVEERRQNALHHIADLFKPPSLNIGDPGKFYYPKAIARFAVYGLEDSAANAFVNVLSTKSLFHFTAVGWIRIAFLYPKAPSILATQTRALEDVFTRSDSYNLFTGEGTENHLTMSRTSAYLFCEMPVPLHLHQKQAFLKVKMKEWVLHQSKLFSQYGTGEWNSSTYGVFNLIGWLNLYDFAQDIQVKEAARQILDVYIQELALAYFKGMITGPEMRGGDETGGLNTGTAYLGWLWFGDCQADQLNTWKRNNGYIQLAHAATSTYHPDPKWNSLALKTEKVKGYYAISKPSYLLEKKKLNIQHWYLQTQWVLASVSTGYGGYTAGCAQMIPWKLAYNSGDSSKGPGMLTGNGRYYLTNGKDIGQGKEPFTDVAQENNILIQMTRTPQSHAQDRLDIDLKITQWDKDWNRDFKQRFPEDSFKKNVVRGMQSRILGKNASYISIPSTITYDTEGASYKIHLPHCTVWLSPVHGLQKAPFKMQDRTIFEDEAPYDQLCGFVLDAINSDSPKNESNKENQLIGNQPQESLQPRVQLLNDSTFIYKSLTKNVDLKYEVNYTAEFTEACVDWGYGVKTPQYQTNAPPFVQPEWPKKKPFRSYLKKISSPRSENNLKPSISDN